MGFKHQLHSILEVNSDHKLSRIYDVFNINLILLNVIAVILESVESIGSPFHLYFKIFEALSIFIFTMEYFSRLWTCNLNDRYAKFPGRLKYAITPMAVVDLLAILPFYLPIFFDLDLRVLRLLRIFRILRLLKLVRYFKTLQKMGRVISSTKEELIITLSAVMVLLVFASTLMFFIENNAQPKIFSSIPAAMWWAVATLTTVGYGDVYPITPLGKALGSFIAMLGVGMVALPAGIIGSGFMEEIQKEKEEEKDFCPHCGKSLNRKLKDH